MRLRLARLKAEAEAEAEAVLRLKLRLPVLGVSGSNIRALPMYLAEGIERLSQRLGLLGDLRSEDTHRRVCSIAGVERISSRSHEHCGDGRVPLESRIMQRGRTVVRSAEGHGHERNEKGGRIVQKWHRVDADVHDARAGLHHGPLAASAGGWTAIQLSRATLTCRNLDHSVGRAEF